MHLKRLIAYTALLLIPLAAAYSGTALSQKVNIPPTHRTIPVSRQHEYSLSSKLNLPQFPLSEGDIEKAVKSHILYQSLLMESKAQSMRSSSSSYSITNPETKDAFQRKLDEFANTMLQYQGRAIGLTQELVPSPRDLALNALTGGVYGQVKDMGTFFKAIDTYNDMSRDIDKFSQELLSGNISEEKQKVIRSSIGSGYNGIIGQAAGKSVAFFSLLEQNPSTRPWLHGEKEFFVRIAQQGSEYPIDVHDERIEKRTANFEGHAGSRWEGLRLTFGNPFSNVYYVRNFGNVVRNPSSSYKKTGLYEVRGVFSGTRDVATFHEDKNTIRYVWRGGSLLKEEEDLFIGGFYGVDGFPVRDDDLKKYFQQYGYNLPVQFDIEVTNVSDKNPQNFIRMRQDANLLCSASNFPRAELNELTKISAYYHVGTKGVQSIEDDLTHLDNLCRVLFSYRADPPFLVTLKPLSSTVVNLTPDAMKTYFNGISGNMSNNLKTLKVELGDRVQSDMGDKKKRLDGLHSTFEQNTGTFTRNLNPSLARSFSDIRSDIERQGVKMSSAPLESLDTSIQEIEYKTNKFLSSPQYKFLRLLERGLQKIF